MIKSVQYKIQKPEILRWEDTPIYTEVELSGTEKEIEINAIEIAEGIAFSQKSDVLWNYKGEEKTYYQPEIYPDGEFFRIEERIILLPEEG